MLLATAPAPAGARRPPVDRPAPVTPAPAATPASGEPAGGDAPSAPTVDKGAIASLLAAADDITRQVVALRGLSVRRPIARGVLSRDEIGRKLRERIAQEYTPSEIAIESRLLKRLGLLPPDVDYQQLLVGLLQEQVAGFYDPFASRLYIADWLGLDLQRPALAHELAHALQDQHFDLKTFAAPIKDNGDRQLARSALVEGDGTAVMLDFVAQSHGFDVTRLPGNVVAAVGKQISAGAMDQSPIYSRAPRFLRETLLFPYFGGMQFVHALRGSRGWGRVDDAFASPPESTTQVLHPEKYLAHEHPVDITAAPIAALAPRAELRRDVLGELELRVLFCLHASDGEAERAAAGWRGDRLVAYGAPEDGSEVAVVDLSAWETEEDARQAEQAFERALPRGTPPPPRDGGPAPGTVEVGGEVWSVERRGDRVLALFGVPADSAAAVAAQVWSGFTVITPPPPLPVAAASPGTPPARRERPRGKGTARHK
jgi:hypothetical protein